MNCVSVIDAGEASAEVLEEQLKVQSDVDKAVSELSSAVIGPVLGTIDGLRRWMMLRTAVARAYQLCLPTVVAHNKVQSNALFRFHNRRPLSNVYLFCSRFCCEVDLVDLDLQAGNAARDASEGGDIKALLAVATLYDTSRLTAVQGLVDGLDGLRNWIIAHTAVGATPLDGLDFDLGVKFAKASSTGRALRDKIFATYLGSCKDFLVVVEGDCSQKESFEAQYIADSVAGKRLRMNLLGKESNSHIVRRLIFCRRSVTSSLPSKTISERSRRKQPRCSRPFFYNSSPLHLSPLPSLTMLKGFCWTCRTNM